MTDFQRKCPLCAGNMLRSREGPITWTIWNKPWGSGWFGFGRERAIPWACMSCGVVLFYLHRLPAIVEEYKRAGEKEPARAIAPEPLKS